MDKGTGFGQCHANRGAGQRLTLPVDVPERRARQGVEHAEDRVAAGGFFPVAGEKGRGDIRFAQRDPSPAVNDQGSKGLPFGQAWRPSPWAMCPKPVSAPRSGLRKRSAFPAGTAVPAATPVRSAEKPPEQAGRPRVPGVPPDPGPCCGSALYSFCPVRPVSSVQAPLPSSAIKRCQRDSGNGARA